MLRWERRCIPSAHTQTEEKKVDTETQTEKKKVYTETQTDVVTCMRYRRVQMSVDLNTDILHNGKYQSNNEKVKKLADDVLVSKLIMCVIRVLTHACISDHSKNII
jgi:archaellum component FlaF (FlaF/FlaG flagellin family)